MLYKKCANYFFRSMFLTCSLLATFSCASKPPYNNEVESLPPKIAEAQKSILKIRAGGITCEGAVIDARKILTTRFCFANSKQAYVLLPNGEQIKGKSRIYKGEFAVIETDSDLNLPVLSTGTAEKFFVEYKNREWHVFENAKEVTTSSVDKGSINAFVFSETGDIVGYARPFLRNAPLLTDIEDDTAIKPLEWSYNFFDSVSTYKVTTGFDILKWEYDSRYGLNSHAIGLSVGVGFDNLFFKGGYKLHSELPTEFYYGAGLDFSPRFNYFSPSQSYSLYVGKSKLSDSYSYINGSKVLVKQPWIWFAEVNVRLYKVLAFTNRVYFDNNKIHYNVSFDVLSLILGIPGYGLM